MKQTEVILFPTLQTWDLKSKLAKIVQLPSEEWDCWTLGFLSLYLFVFCSRAEFKKKKDSFNLLKISFFDKCLPFFYFSVMNMLPNLIFLKGMIFLLSLCNSHKKLSLYQELEFLIHWMEFQIGVALHFKQLIRSL